MALQYVWEFWLMQFIRKQYTRECAMQFNGSLLCMSNLRIAHMLGWILSINGFCKFALCCCWNNQLQKFCLRWNNSFTTPTIAQRKQQCKSAQLWCEISVRFRWFVRNNYWMSNNSQKWNGETKHPRKEVNELMNWWILNGRINDQYDNNWILIKNFPNCWNCGREKINSE